jgi:hypothetical protein
MQDGIEMDWVGDVGEGKLKNGFGPFKGSLEEDEKESKEDPIL